MLPCQHRADVADEPATDSDGLLGVIRGPQSANVWDFRFAHKSEHSRCNQVSVKCHTATLCLRCTLGFQPTIAFGLTAKPGPAHFPTPL
jgi:hypothetical protein